MNEELKVIISAEIDKLKQNLNNAKTSVKDFVADAKKKFTDFNDDLQKAGDVSKKALGIAGAAIAGAATALLGLAASTAEYRQNQAKLNTSFTEAGYSADVAKAAYNDLYRVLGDDGQATEAAQHLSLLGLTTEELEGLTYSLQGVYAQFGDSLPIEGLTEAINHTAQLGEVQGPLADALEWVGITTDDFNKKLAECDSETERAQLIASTLAGEYDGLAASYEDTNAEVLAQNEAQAKLNETLATVGEAIAPIMTALTTLASDVLAQLTPYITQFAEDYLPQIQEALSGVGEKIGEVITWIVDNWDMITTIAGIVLGIAAAIAVVSTVMSVVNGVMTLLSMNPIVLFIIGLIAAIALCIAYWDEIKAKVSEVVENVKTTVNEWVENIKAKFEEIKTNISEKVEAAKEAVVGTFNTIKTTITTTIQNAKQSVVNKFNEIKTGITEKINAVKTSISSVFTSIQTTITSKINTAKTNVLSVFESIKTGISTKIENAKTTVSDAVEAIKGFFDFEWSLPNISLPHFSVSGGVAPWGFGGKGSLPRISVSWYEMGGVFDSPMLFNYANGQLGGLGENGAEAVVPLEKNTYWLERMADMVAARQGKTPIVLNVDGKTFAQTSIDSINALTRQTGNLALNLV